MVTKGARRFLFSWHILGMIDEPRWPVVFGRDPDGAAVETRVRIVAGKGKRRRGVRR